MPHQAPLQSGDPRRVGRYRLAGRVAGIPADGPIFLGSSPDGTEVTISILRGDWARDGAARDRFAAEAAVAKRVPPFCAARILDSGLEGSDAYLVSEYVPGKSLIEVISSEGLLSPAELGPLAIGMATGLASVHYAGLVHGSFGPEYVVMTASGPRVVEFGITPPYGAATPAADMLAWAQTVVFAASGRPATSVADLEVLSGRLRELVLDCLSPDPAARPAARATVQALIGQDEIPAGLLAEGSRRAQPGGFAGPGGSAGSDSSMAAVGPGRWQPPGPSPGPAPGPPWEPQEPPGRREPAGRPEPQADRHARTSWDQSAQPAGQPWPASGLAEPGRPQAPSAAGPGGPGQPDDGPARRGLPAAPAGRPGTHGAGAHATGTHGTRPRAVSRHARTAVEWPRLAGSGPRSLPDGAAPGERPRPPEGNGGSAGGTGRRTGTSFRGSQRRGSGGPPPRTSQRGGPGGPPPRTSQRGRPGGSSPRTSRGVRTGALAGAAALVVALIVFTAMRALGDHTNSSSQAGPEKSTHSMSLRTSVSALPSPAVTPTTPAAFAGAWSGQAQQPPNDTYSVSLILPSRSSSGTVRYSTAGVAPFSCRLVLTSVSDDELTFSEASQGSCTAGTVTLTRSGTGAATYEFQGGGVVATGSLSRS